MMERAFKAQRQFLAVASTSQKPSDDVLTRLLQPISEVIAEVQQFREKNRSSQLFNHLSTVSESVPALGWVAITPKPGPFVKEMQDAGMFYSNRVLKDYKEKDKTHVDWVKAYTSIWTDLQKYIKDHHTTGLAWSKTGPVASGSAAPTRAPAGGAPPPPPPGPPPPPMDLGGSSGGGDSGPDTRNALFAAINQGSNITKEGAQGLVINDTELKQVVYAYKCNKSTLQVKGKINSITIDNCKKMGLVFDDVVGIVEIINCKDVKIQVMGKVPTISINKTDGCHVYLSKDSLSCEIVSAKSSEMNILVPGNDGDFTECPVPEQFKTVWDGKKLVTTATEIAG
uniref:CAP, adenylate cyclase-associated protein 1 (yeast) n=1 Tax=Sparus aurata TaxID=8175 RepID=A0A671UB66_SPAAU